MIMRKKLYLIRNKLDLMKDFYKKKIIKNLSLKCTNLMELINTPSLTNNDVKYFKYKSYNITKDQARYISKLVGTNKNYFEFSEKKGKVKGKLLLSPIEIKYGNFFKKLVNIFIKKI